MEIKEGFFLKRPIFATVISIVITLVGIICLRTLPIEQFPDLTPPQVFVVATYNGANADVISQNVASVLEGQINGVDDMIYMNSTSSGSGRMMLTITFAIGTNPDMATINVNNRVQQAASRLPAEVRQIGVTVVKRNPSMLMMVALTSPDGRYDSVFLSNYAKLNLVDDLKTVDGVGDVMNFASQDYSIRVWLNPNKLTSLGLTPADVARAISAQNAQFAAGAIGDSPMGTGSELYWQIVAPNRLSDPKEFEDIILRTNTDGSILRVKDVARIELGAEAYDFIGRINGSDATPMGIFLSPGANALATAERINTRMDQLAENFPEGVAFEVPFDTTTFIRISIEEVVKTLLEAMVLVFIVVFVFLQNWRATLIPCIAVPVSIIGTFAGMYALGFSINTLTMFAMVLSIGLVVDDAIIVLENVERLMATGLSVRKATAQAMNEVTRPVIAVVFVLCSVFIPVAFMGGMAGKMYQQFAITIVISVVISGIVALTFTPAVCMLILKKGKEEKSHMFRWFNKFFDKTTNGYLAIVKGLLKWNSVTVLLYAATIAAVVFILPKIPSGLVPNEDQGVVMGMLVLPEGASINRTDEAVKKLNQMLMADPSVDKVTSFTGMDMFSFTTKPNYAAYFIGLKDWDERTTPGTSSYDLAKKIYGMGMAIPNGIAFGFNPPPISGMSSTGGFEMWVQNRAGDPSEKLYNYVQQIIAKARMRPELTGLSNTMAISSPQLKVTIDREKTMSMGVAVADVFAVMQSIFGKYYINDFNMYGNTYRVYAEGDAEFRATPGDIKKLYVRNSAGGMIPISEFIKVEERGGTNTLDRFNNFPATQIMGSPAIGYSSGQAMDVIAAVADEVLPPDYSIAWSGSAYQEKQTSSGASGVLILAMVMVFLILAAQYESWALPFAVVVSVPFAILGAAVSSYFMGYSNDIYFQVALVTLIGLAAKNAILIVEFAIEKYRSGHMTITEAAIEGARLRFRPIIMTSLAFIFGCLPLAISTGAGSASRNVLGTAVVGGMIFATVLAPMFIPFFFKVVMMASTKLFPPAKEEEEEA